jgi:kynurenine formamidase
MLALPRGAARGLGTFLVVNLAVGHPGLAVAGALERVIAARSPIVDLTHPLNDRIPGLPPGEAFRNEPGVPGDGSSVRFTFAAQAGTHVDAPAQIARGGPSVDKIPPQNLLAHAVVVDISRRTEGDPDATGTLDDLRAWERRNGRVPRAALVILRTGWDKRWGDPARYRNADENGLMHFPGFSVEVVQFLLKERDIHGIGTDAPAVDPGAAADQPVRALVLSAGKIQVKNLANLDKLPPKGVKLVIAPLAIEGATSAPARVLAILP